MNKKVKAVLQKYEKELDYEPDPQLIAMVVSAYKEELAEKEKPKKSKSMVRYCAATAAIAIIVCISTYSITEAVNNSSDLGHGHDCLRYYALTKINEEFDIYSSTPFADILTEQERVLLYYGQLNSKSMLFYYPGGSEVSADLKIQNYEYTDISKPSSINIEDWFYLDSFDLTINVYRKDKLIITSEMTLYPAELLKSLDTISS